MSERTLNELIEAVKNGEKPDYDELFYGLLALSYLHAMDVSDMLKIHTKTTDWTIQFTADESFKRSKRAGNIVPKQYVGWDYDPANPDYQAHRQAANRLLDRILNSDDKDE